MDDEKGDLAFFKVFAESFAGGIVGRGDIHVIVANLKVSTEQQSEAIGVAGTSKRFIIDLPRREGEVAYRTEEKAYIDS